MYSHINARINWFQTNQDIYSKSNVSGDGETRTLTPLLVPDSNSGVSTFHHTPINPGFIHLKETKETLTKNLQDPQSQHSSDLLQFTLLLQSAAIATMRSSQKLLTHNLCLGSEWDSNPRKHAPQACAYTSRPSLPYFERHGRIELPSPAWQAGIITTILMPQNFYNHRLVEHPRLTIFCQRPLLYATRAFGVG